MRKTKIICTIGPACSDEETIRRMCLAGMNVARLNFSHGTHEDHLKNIQTIRQGARRAAHAHCHHAGHEGPRIPHRQI